MGYMDFMIYCTDLKIAQHVMYMSFATSFQTCTFLFMNRVSLVEGKT